LLGLVQSNTPETVEETTKNAYAALWKGKQSQPDAISALKILVGLKGVGPATASLLLSVLRPAEIPFFSDELFRWCVWDEDVGNGKVGKGWQRKIKYNLKEYEMLLERVNKLRPRLRNGLGTRDTAACSMDVERVAWVLGKEGMDVGVQEDEGKDDGLQANEREEAAAAAAVVAANEQDEKNVSATKESDGDEEKVKTPAEKKGTKRKASEPKQPTEGTRKSTRTKK
jgi:hypothetical protein